MPPNSSPTFTPHTPTSLVQLLVYKPIPLLTPPHSALPLSFLLLTPLPPPPSHSPPTRLILPLPLPSPAPPCLDACHPCPSKSFPPAVLASPAALLLLSAALTPP